MNVAHWNMRFFPLVGGIGTHIESVNRNNMDVQFDVVTNALRGQRTEERFSANTAIHRFRPYDPVNDRWQRWGRKILVPQSACAEILRTHRQRNYLRSQPPDIIHMHDIDKYTVELLQRFGSPRKLLKLFNGMFKPEKLPAPTLLTMHFDMTIVPGSPWGIWQRSFSTQFSNVIVLSKSREESWRRTFKEMGLEANIWCIPNGVDTNLYRPAASSPAREFVVGYVGRLDVLKGEQLLRDIVRSLPPDMIFHAAVPGGERVPAWIADLPKDRCRISYDVPFNKMPGFYKSLNVLINTTTISTTDRVTLEGMSCGVPVIKVAAGDDFPVIDGENGRIVGPDALEFINAITRLREDPQALDRFAKSARKMIETEFDEKRMAAEVREVYLMLARS